MSYINTLGNGAPLRVYTFLSTLYKINTGYYGGRADTRKPISHKTAFEEYCKVSGVEVRKMESIRGVLGGGQKNGVNSWSVG